MVSPDRKFIHAECGINGVVSDGGVFNHSEFKQMLDSDELNLPEDLAFVGDSAFPLRRNLMKPFGGRGCVLNQSQKRFNKKLRGARVIVEHVFGILTSRFKCLKGPLNVKIDNAKLITLACCVVHNFLTAQSPSSYLAQHGQDSPIELPSLNSTGLDQNSSCGERCRLEYCNYFDSLRNRAN